VKKGWRTERVREGIKQRITQEIDRKEYTIGKESGCSAKGGGGKGRGDHENKSVKKSDRRERDGLGWVHEKKTQVPKLYKKISPIPSGDKSVEGISWLLGLMRTHKGLQRRRGGRVQNVFCHINELRTPTYRDTTKPGHNGEWDPRGGGNGGVPASFGKTAFPPHRIGGKKRATQIL